MHTTVVTDKTADVAWKELLKAEKRSRRLAEKSKTHLTRVHHEARAKSYKTMADAICEAIVEGKTITII